MTNYLSKDLYSGLKIIFDQEPYSIESSEFVKPGKGQSFVRVKMRRLFTGKQIEKTFKATDIVEKADVIKLNLIYLYNDGMIWYFMEPNTFEQFTANHQVIGDNAKWIIEQAECIVTLWNGNAIIVTPPHLVELQVINTDPSLKGDSVTTSTKYATLSTGAVIKVPLFVKRGEIVKVNTQSSEYISRIK
ncbi:MAG: elongation factor P [Candidatus Dasytiphilus stammeri]